MKRAILALGVVALVGATAVVTRGLSASKLPAAAPAPGPTTTESTPSLCQSEQTQLDRLVRHWNKLKYAPGWGHTNAQHVRGLFWWADQATVLHSDFLSLGPVVPALRQLALAFGTGLKDMQIGERDLAESWEPSGSYRLGVTGNALWHEGTALLKHATSLARTDLCPA